MSGPGKTSALEKLRAVGQASCSLFRSLWTGFKTSAIVSALSRSTRLIAVGCIMFVLGVLACLLIGDSPPGC
jgi:hypothetical protein